MAEIRFEDFANQWHAAVTGRLSDNTRVKYRRYLDKQLIPRWGDWPMIGIFNSHFDIETWVTHLHGEYEDSSVASYFGCFSTIMNAAVKARVIPANPCSGIRVTGGEWESEKFVATPLQVLRASMRLYENELGLSGLLFGLLNAYTGGRWGELAGQTRPEYDEVKKAIAVFEPLKEIDGRLFKSGADVTERTDPLLTTARRSRRSKRNARTKSPAGERWVPLPPSIAAIYELFLATRPSESFVFTSLHGKPWYRSNFRQRFWRPAWDGVDADKPSSKRYVPAIMSGFRFHEGRHTHATWLTEDGIPEVARRGRLGHKVKGMGRVYDHVTPEMERQILAALEERWIASVLALEEDERQKLLGRVPVIRDTIKKAQQEAAMLAAKLVGGERFSQISPTGTLGGESSGGRDAS
ncbi:tyrosine-type recombinase/integrase [Kribbella caucasensis]|uniref:tyrosine-type recombinase/integrase n=1 Tax=Kribbella caucasensis TaxID=2512215 RepID=UPI00192D2F15|nr:tyrosine-type recombinase/integrase [Kribbella sp. VKM Ac-2527]